MDTNLSLFVMCNTKNHLKLLVVYQKALIPTFRPSLSNDK